MTSARFSTRLTGRVHSRLRPPTTCHRFPYRLIGYVVVAVFSMTAAAYEPPKTGRSYWDVSPDGRVFFVQRDGSFEEFMTREECRSKLDIRTQVLKQIACREAFTSAEKKHKRALTPYGNVRATNQYCLKHYVPLTTNQVLALQDDFSAEIETAKTDMASTRKAKGLLSVAELQYEAGCLIEILYQRLELNPKTSMSWAARKRRGAEKYELPPHPGKPIAFPTHRPPTGPDFYAAGWRSGDTRVKRSTK